MSTLLETLLEQERDLTLPSFSNTDAFELGCIARELVCRLHPGKGVAIQIDRCGITLFSCLMDGAVQNNQLWIQRKRRTAELYGHSSMYVGEDLRVRGKSLEPLYPAAEYQAEGGCFPIILKDTGMIGSITISGLISADDHAICTEALRQLLARKSN